MTTDTHEASKGQDDEEQSILPTILAGAGILAVAALLIFWPSDDAAKGGDGANGGKAGVSDGSKAGGRGKGGRAAGVGSRPSDAATKPEPSGNRNPAIKLPATAHGMAPIPEAVPKDPPEGASDEDKIAFYEKRLKQAIHLRDTRKKFAERLPVVQARIEASPKSRRGHEGIREAQAHRRGQLRPGREGRRGDRRQARRAKRRLTCPRSSCSGS